MSMQEKIQMDMFVTGLSVNKKFFKSKWASSTKCDRHLNLLLPKFENVTINTKFRNSANF